MSRHGSFNHPRGDVEWGPPPRMRKGCAQRQDPEDDKLKRQSTKHQGFTLIEVMVALFIFAILGTITAIGLHSVIKTYRHVKTADQQLQKLQLAMTLMRRDTSQVVDRSIVDAKGKILPAFMVNGAHAFELTTQNNRLQRIGYALKDGQWVRLTWPELNRSSHMVPSRKVLLSHVKNVRLKFVNDKGKIGETWSASASFPQAIVITLTLQDQKKLVGIFPTPARGAYGS